MLQPLDLPTLLLLHKLSFFIAALCFLYVRSQSRESVGLGLLAMGFFMVALASTISAIGKLVTGFEDQIALIGNVAGLTGYCIFWVGVCRISGQRKRSKEWLILFLPLVGGLFLFATGLYTSMQARTVAWQGTASLMLAAAAYRVNADKLVEALPVRKALSVSLSFASVLTFLVVAGVLVPNAGVVVARNAFFVSIVCHFAIAFFVMALVNERTEERLRKLADVDVLTGVPNRRSFTASLPESFRPGDAVIMIDIDYFKRVNDGFGHLAGDEVLARVARELSSRVRPVDSFARFGGEEFILFLPEIGEQEAIAFAESTRQIVSAVRHDIEGQRVAVTLSMGLAICDDKATKPLSLIRKADMALYLSKSAGRDRLTVYRAAEFDDERVQNAMRHAG